MFKRLAVYFKEMFPIPSRILASLGLFAGIYLLTLYTQHIVPHHLGIGEVIAVYTVFGVLLCLRIVDEFKDYETDKINFPKRPLPSGRVKKSDLQWVGFTVLGSMIVLNALCMNNIWFFVAMAVYGGLMSVWFFARKIIQPNLLLALITHNPIQLFLIFYVISFVAYSYGFSVFSMNTLSVAFVLYIPALAWELSRKIRAPKEENQYVTYSQIFGRKRAIAVVLAVFLVQLVAAVYLFRHEHTVWLIGLVVMYGIYGLASLYDMRHPTWQNYGKIARAYMYCFQLAILVIYGAAVLA